MTTIIITIRGTQLNAQLYDTPTAKTLAQALPMKSTALVWGDEIYFKISVKARLEADAREVVEVGDLAYWPTMPAFCIFFGATPVSIGNEPRAASRVNVFGKLIDPDLEFLRQIEDGEEILVSVVEDP
jgi:hypothetical protein